MRRFGAGLRTFLALSACFVAGGTLASCTSDSAKKHYVLAEKLWNDGKYASAVAEFDRVVAKDPKGKLGALALLRSATTQAFFLSRYDDAVRKLRAYATSPSADPKLAWDAQQQIGEILFSKTEQYDLAIQHYQALIQAKPQAPEAPLFKFRVAKSYFFLRKFDEAVDSFRQIIAQYPDTIWAQKAGFEIAVTHYTRGEQRPGPAKDRKSAAYHDAIEAYQDFLKRYPGSELAVQARFGIAACLEELDQLDAAYRAYEALRNTYPSPNVIAIKLARIRERQAQRSR